MKENEIWHYISNDSFHGDIKIQRVKIKKMYSSAMASVMVLDGQGRGISYIYCPKKHLVKNFKTLLRRYENFKNKKIKSVEEEIETKKLDLKKEINKYEKKIEKLGTILG